jgi:hypothetical protein
MRIYLTCVCVMLATAATGAVQKASQSYKDRPFTQDFSERVPLDSSLRGVQLLEVRADRNGRIAVLSDKGLLQVYGDKLRPDRLHRPLANMKIRDIEAHQGQFAYLTDRQVLSNAWAGRLLVDHNVPDASLLAMGEDFQFLLAADRSVALFNQQGQRHIMKTPETVTQAAFDEARGRFLLLAGSTLSCPEVGQSTSQTFHHDGLTCMALTDENRTLLVGTRKGYLRLDPVSLKALSPIETKLPCTDIRCIREIDDKLWFGTPHGAFALHRSGQIDYYASRRWLVDDFVVDIAPGPDDSVLVLSQRGLSIIHFKETTLAEKAGHFDRLTRQRHIRYGFNSALVMTEPGDLSTGTLIDQDNDGLWTAMYLAGELFRYAATKSDEALHNCYESFEAMERLTEITPMEGFPARAIERAGYQVADKPRWQVADDKRWVWKATTSSDEIVGHFFVYAVFAEIVPDAAWRQRAIDLMDSIMDHIVRHDWYLVDYDGRPTQWGRWHPDYVNQFPRAVGDRRLNSVEIIAFLQTAHHFTGKEIYRRKTYELFEKHGYLDNIMIPITEIGRVPGIDLSTEWNHSDDELAFLSYWNLYRYAFTDELKDKYRQAIRGHWEIERPEKNPLWSFIYAATGAEDFDLHEAIWSLRHFPLDAVSWTVTNSHRQDLEFLEPNFREHTTANVLPPDERPVRKFNANAFQLDGGNGGRREFSGDIYLLPYWMGRYLKIIQ